MYRNLFRWIGVLSVVFSSTALAQAEYGIHQKSLERVNAASKVAPLTTDIFGERVSLFNGATTFSNIDISIPGNTSLKVSLAREYSMEDRGQIQPLGRSHLGGFGEWDIDLPHVKGTFLSHIGWKVVGSDPYARCTAPDEPISTGAFNARDYWSGYHFHRMAQGDTALLYLANGAFPTPTNGQTYTWNTKENWRFSCTATTKNAYPGQGFVAHSPDGKKYYLDWVVTRQAPSIRAGFTYSTYDRSLRDTIFFMVSRVEDAFGNWVNYSYTGDKLTSITASDGRFINLSYSGSNVVSVTSSIGTWTYSYVNGRLSSVALPDGSNWAYTTVGELKVTSVDPLIVSDWVADCNNVEPDNGGEFRYTVKHPGGASAAYYFRLYRNFRHNIPKLCEKPRVDYEYWIIPNWSDNYAIQSKTVTGVGLPEMVWTYTYGNGNRLAFRQNCPNWGTFACTISKVNTVQGPDKIEKYEFGILYEINEGQLLKKETRTLGDVLLRTETYNYVSETDLSSMSFDGYAGNSLVPFGDEFSSAGIRPVKQQQVLQDGVAFTSKTESDCGAGSALCFDQLGRPTKTVQFSSVAGSASRVVAEEFHDDWATWVLGQVKRTTTNSVETSATTYGWKALPTQTTQFGKITQALTYDSTSTVASGQLGTLKTVKDGNNNTTTFGSWKRGIPQTISYADGTSQSALVDDRGWITWVEDESDSRTCYTYDTMGRLASTTYTSESAANTCDASTWTATNYTWEYRNVAEHGLPAGHWLRRNHTGNHRRNTFYDVLWRPVLEHYYDGADTNGSIQARAWAYDTEGRMTFASYPVNALVAGTTGTWTDYDALGRVTAVSQDSEQGLLTTTTQYLGDATSAYVRTVSPRGVVTVTRYQAFDQPSYDTPVLIDQGQNLTERVGIDITRDVFGKPLSIRKRNAAGTLAITRSYTYNANQELCRSVEPETGATLMGYDGAGNLSWSAAGLPAATACEANGTGAAVVARKAARTYDTRNRVKTLVFPDGRGNTTNTYTPDGLLASIVADNGPSNVVTTAYTHNRRRLLTQERTTWGSMDWPISYTYTALGHLASHIYPNGQTVAYAPNALGQPTQAGPYATGVQYYPNGGMKQFSYGNGIVHTMTQNARQLPARSTDSNGVLDLGYVYDKHANPVSITDYTAGARQSRAMIYNGLDQLLQTTGASFGVANYSYNVLDNLTSMKVTGGSNVRDHTYHYDASNRLTSVTNSASGATVVGLQYDPQGNLSNKNGQGYTFDFGNRLRTADSLVSYYYDGHGRRVRDVTAAGSKYSQYSLGGQLMYANDVRQGVGTQYVYLNGSLVAFRESTGTVKYQHTDALGTPIAVTDAAKAIVQKSEYEPYGQLVNRALTDGPGFTGHVQDAATGLTYMQQRYYDPGIGRFLSVDPVIALSNPVGMFNRYKYAANNPYKFTDPDGRCERVTGSRICGGRGFAGSNLSGVRSVGPEACSACGAKTKNYETKSGVRWSAAVEGKVDRIADRYNTATGGKITVTGGNRTAGEQAREMYGKITSGEGLGLYRNRDAAREIQSAYDNAVRSRATPEATMAAMTRTISDQMSNGVYISKHLIEGAVDVRSRDMSGAERTSFRQSATGIADTVLLETANPHWHLQFNEN
ncbi:RHS repeat domain-containing protein [Pseudoxanthomonas beigongshangi]